MGELRRRRMAKLTRTLGEVVPSHLVCMNKPLPSNRHEPAVTRGAGDCGLFVDVSELGEAQRDVVDDARADQRVHMNILPPSSSVSGPDLFEHRQDTATKARTDSSVYSTTYGDWNRKNIREVQRQLRHLKSR